MTEKRLLLIIGGGIAAYKCLELIRRLRERGHSIRTVMTGAATQFITPLSVSALTNERVFTDLFDLDDEREIGHIRLSREADAIIVAPTTADLMAKMAQGLACDLASAVLLASDAPVLLAPAMNTFMWRHPATQRNAAQLKNDGVHFVGPDVGEMAEAGEAGPGRLAETGDIIAAIEALPAKAGTTAQTPGPLDGRHILVTSGPTHEPIDPVRYIANRSSGRQGHAIAAAAADAGARVTLISGPVTLPVRPGVHEVRVETARQMLAATQEALPADVAIFTAAVADWRVADEAGDKIKKGSGSDTPALKLVENPDILETVATARTDRPRLIIGFAAETCDVIEHARAKLKRKGADWIVANDVAEETGVLGGEHNTVHVLSADGIESWPKMSKDEVARRLVARIADACADGSAS